MLMSHMSTLSVIVWGLGQESKLFTSEGEVDVCIFWSVWTRPYTLWWWLEIYQKHFKPLIRNYKNMQ